MNLILIFDLVRFGCNSRWFGFDWLGLGWQMYEIASKFNRCERCGQKWHASHFITQIFAFELKNVSFIAHWLAGSVCSRCFFVCGSGLVAVLDFSRARVCVSAAFFSIFIGHILYLLHWIAGITVYIMFFRCVQSFGKQSTLRTHCIYVHILCIFSFYLHISHFTFIEWRARCKSCRIFAFVKNVFGTE